MRAEKFILTLITALMISYISSESFGETLILDVPISSVAEDGNNFVATVTRSGDTTNRLSVNIDNSDFTELYAPASVLISPGNSSAEFIIEIVNDGEIDGTQKVTVTVSAEGFEQGSKTLDVQDDDTSDKRTIGGHLFGTINSNTYIVLSDMIIDVGQTLEIEPDSTLRFNSGVGLVAKGSLIAVGELGKEVIFTSNADPPAPEDWKGIENMGNDEQDSILSHVIITFARTGLKIDGERPRILVVNSDISHNSVDGIAVHEASSNRVQILEDRIHHNGENGVRASAYSWGCYVGAHVEALIRGNEIYNNQRGIYLSASSSSLWGCICIGGWCSLPSATVAGEVSGNYVHHNQRGISAYSSRYWIDDLVWGKRSGNWTNVYTLIHSNIVVGNNRVGISITTGGDLGGYLGSDVINNTVVGNGGAGISHSANVSTDCTILNNIVCKNGSGIKAGSIFDPNNVQNCVVGYNNVVDNNDNNWINYPTEYGVLTTINENGTPSDFVMNISVDPYFVEPGYWDPNGTPEDANDDFWVEGDYHLLPDSPCIDAGDPNGSYDDQVDIDGDPRVMCIVDIGADEVGCFPIDITVHSGWLYMNKPDFCEY